MFLKVKSVFTVFARLSNGKMYFLDEKNGIEKISFDNLNRNVRKNCALIYVVSFITKAQKMILL